MKMVDYYYKGYDISNNNRLEKLMMELQNPYGYNLDSNKRRVKDEVRDCTFTNQNYVKTKNKR